jgi:hypothetical protein
MKDEVASVNVRVGYACPIPVKLVVAVPIDLEGARQLPYSSISIRACSPFSKYMATKCSGRS